MLAVISEEDYGNIDVELIAGFGVWVDEMLGLDLILRRGLNEMNLVAGMLGGVG